MSTRKNFVRSVAAGTLPAVAEPAPASAAAGWTPSYFPLVRRGAYDYDAMMRVLDDPSPHKQMFLSNPSTMEIPGTAAVFERMANAWTAYEFSLRPSPAREKLSVAAVLIAAPVVFALDDAMWRKYRIGSFFKLTDRFGKIAAANVTAPAWSNLDPDADPGDLRSIYHDYTSAALLRRGARFLVCHNALAGVSLGVAKASGLSHASVLADWASHTLPGFTVVPAGAMAIQLALEHGWKLYPVTD